jgi:hypothetical protein
MIKPYSIFSDVIDIIESAENTNEINRMANCMIKAINHIRNSELYAREHTFNNFKEVNIRTI